MSNNKLIVALDMNSREEALELVEEIRDKVGVFKVGLELFNASGPQIIHEIQSLGVRVFYDAKFHDIPNTVSQAVSVATRLGVWMINVHCAGGLEMLRAARESVIHTAKELNQSPPLLIGVTLLTSIQEKILHDELGIPGTIESTVLRYARLAKEAGLDGVVCSGHEIVVLRKEFGKDFCLVVPGIRPSWSVQTSDQKRIMTPKQAIDAGADYLVIGRPITQSPDPIEAVTKILEEI